MRPPPGEVVVDTATVTFDGSNCDYDGPTRLTPGGALHVEFANESGTELQSASVGSAFLAIRATNGTMMVMVPSEPGAVNEGFTALDADRYSISCDTWSVDSIPGAVVTVAESPQPELSDDPGASGVSGTAAAKVATDFAEAFAAFDVDRTLALFGPDPQLGFWASEDGLRMDMMWSRAVGYQQDLHECVVLEQAPDQTTVLCPFDFHAFGSGARGLGPYAGTWRITVDVEGVVSAYSDWNYQQNGFGREVADPFFEWLQEHHPDDLAAMYTAAGYSLPAWTDESIALWERRAREFVDAVTRDPT